MHAVDLSPVFCDAVRRKARAAGLTVHVHCQDMRDFTLPRPVDLVLAEFASLNNLADRRDLPRVLGSVARALAVDGWFLFDVNTPLSLRTQYPQTFYCDGDATFRLVQHGAVEADGRRARLDFDWYVPLGTRLAPRARNDMARRLDRCRDPAGITNRGLQPRAEVRRSRRAPEAGPREARDRCVLPFAKTKVRKSRFCECSVTWRPVKFDGQVRHASAESCGADGWICAGFSYTAGCDASPQLIDNG